ncbi:MAG: endonuclease/exonuclease/phosphatase family protein [Acidimicrobiaceae bacterium]|nr:endonuclease/exonuclease/phosphatase family protein [Acidimicrobiaceae bacterium]
MADHFSSDQWKQINKTLDEDPERYGFPQRREGSVLLGSFNIRKLGDPTNRTNDDWAFLARICAQFDLLAVQEIMSNLDGLRHLREKLKASVDGRDEGFAAVVSDETGAFAGDRGLRERLGFLYRWPIVERMEIASDLTYDRTKTLQTLVDNAEALTEALDECNGNAKNFDPEFFVTFTRQPHGVEFRIPGADPYEFMAVNAHLIFGTRIDHRRQEFTALLELLKSRLVDNDKINLILMGDLNLDFNDPENDRPRIDKEIKDRNGALADAGSHINFPFLDAHKNHDGVFRTNARRSQTYDHIGLFAHDPRLPTYGKNEQMPETPEGPDYGVFDFMTLFSEALYEKPWTDLTNAERKTLWKNAEHSVSDHMPLWLRLPHTA